LPNAGAVSYIIGYANGSATITMKNANNFTGTGTGDSDTTNTKVLLDSWSDTAFVLPYQAGSTSAGDINSAFLNNTFNNDSAGDEANTWKKGYQWWAIVDPRNYLLSQIGYFFEPTKFGCPAADPSINGAPIEYTNLPAPLTLLSTVGF
jgi:hypothetical protein